MSGSVQGPRAEHPASDKPAPEPPILEVSELVVDYGTGRHTVNAVAGVSFDVGRGETFGLVGESGCGKSTTAKAIVQLVRPTSGSVKFNGVDLSQLHGEVLRRTRVDVQMIFQDPTSSLNPRRRVREIVAEGLAIWSQHHDRTTDERIDEMLAAVGLDPEATGRRKPSELSGGQCQRVSIARALITNPQLVVCDEVVSALDVSVQAQVLNLLEHMKSRLGLTLVFVSHDLAVVKNISDRIGVMYLGKLCEVSDSVSIHRRPLHPYTQLLIDSIPRIRADPAASTIADEGDRPSASNPPSGCRFRTRCAYAEDLCAQVEPELHEHEPGHFVACHFAGALGS
jgi:peptide/nickel transport system ATP-binding protein